MDNDILDFLNLMDSTTKYHCIRTSTLVEEIAKRTNEKINILSLQKAASLHDIGKAFIPSCIIEKSGKINDFEREVIDLHSYFGYKFLLTNKFDDDVCNIILFHHGLKSLNGFNYMDMFLPSEEILIAAEILRTADAYDALTSTRPYRGKYSHSSAVEILKEEKFNLKYIEAIESLGELKMNEAWFKEKEEAILKRFIDSDDDKFLTFLGFEPNINLKTALFSTKVKVNEKLMEGVKKNAIF